MTRPLVVAALVAGIACSMSMAKAAEDRTPVDPKLAALNKIRPVRTVVAKYFPEATYIFFENNLHFEDSTQLYVEEMISKLPARQKPQLEMCRGPKSTCGVWCDVVLLKGECPPYQRSEGATPRKHFVEHMIYQDLHGIDCHLYVTLRVPKGGKRAEFVKDFTALIRSCSHDFVTDK